MHPLPETTQLYQAILEQREPKAPQRMDTRPASPVGDRPKAMAPTLPSLGDQVQESRPGDGQALSSLPLVGRSAEWCELQRVYDGVNHGGHFVLLEGEAGIGKTRLAEEFLATVRAQGGATLQARCYQGEEDLAYSPFVESVRWALARPEQAARLDSVPPTGWPRLAVCCPNWPASTPTCLQHHRWTARPPRAASLRASASCCEP